MAPVEAQAFRDTHQTIDRINRLEDQHLELTSNQVRTATKLEGLSTQVSELGSTVKHGFDKVGDALAKLSPLAASEQEDRDEKKAHKLNINAAFWLAVLTVAGDIVLRIGEHLLKK